MKHIEAMKLAQSGLPEPSKPHTMKWTQLEMDYINKRVEAAVRQAIEQAEQAQPVAWSEPTPDFYITELSRNTIKYHNAVHGKQEFSKNKLNECVVPVWFAPPPRRPLTDEMVVAAARMLSDRQAAACNVDCGDMWKMHGNDFIEDARAALEAAHGIKGEA